mmetsp:Transcript_67934/g.202229  ORF Transcript_67934/g.202229 Transcript_67934/m.202229 type:complete len:166 (+) Transcript_67934:49-546(+)
MAVALPTAPGELGALRLVWCIRQLPWWLPWDLPCDFFSERPALFARWLCRQPGGPEKQGVALITGVREAKHCLQVILAARKDNANAARGCGMAMRRVVVLSDPAQQEGATVWAETCSHIIDVRVAGSSRELLALLKEDSNVASDLHTASSPQDLVLREIPRVVSR